MFQRIFFSLIAFIFLLHNAGGQNLYSLNALWDDDLRQWTLECNEGELEVTIQMRWRMKNDITVWDFSVDGLRGSISQKWDNNPNFWELRSPNGIVTISTVYTNDFTSFRIKNNKETIIVERPDFRPDPIEWSIRNESHGNFYWYNEFEYDLRDWIIYDELHEEFPFEMKLAAVFITVLYSLING